MSKTWFVTGISSGLGRSIAQTAMDNGDFVIGTFRKQDQIDLFNDENNGRAFAIKMDVTNPKDIVDAFGVIEKRFGWIDILVNNAGFGFAGAIEETSMVEVRTVMETNFFGAFQITQNILPIFRKQKSGHIIQISSHGGIKAFPGFGIYNASKFALEGFSEALAAEVAHLGIKVTLVEPGPFRTEFAGSSFRVADQIIEDYNNTAGAFRQKIKQIHGLQEGDPEKAAHAIYQITRLDEPPLRLPLGKMAVVSIRSKLESVTKDLEQCETVAQSAVFD